MPYDQIRTFLMVTKTGSFTKAAEALSLTQPAISQQIQALEKLLGVRLFDRAGKTLRMNAAGMRFLQYAKFVSLETDELIQDIKSMDGEELGSLSIGAINSVGIYLLPGIIAKYQTMHPFAKIRLSIGNTESIIEGLLHGDLDLALLDTQLTNLRSFQCEFLLEEELVLAAAPNHPILNETTFIPERLYEVPLIMRKNASRTRCQLETELKNAGFDLDRLNVVYEFDSNEAIKQSIMAGLGCGFLPLEVIRQALRWGEIGFVEGFKLHRKLWFFSRGGDGMEFIKAFTRYLVQELSSTR